jgi:hypothetical protein
MSVNVNGIVTRLESVRRDIKKLNLSESNTHTTNSGRMDQSDHAFPEVASPEQNDQHYEPASLSSEVPSRVDTSALTPIPAVHMCAVCGNTGHLAVACALTLRARQPEISQTRPVQDTASVEEGTAPMDQIGLGQQYSSHPALRPKEPPMFQGRVEDKCSDLFPAVEYFCVRKSTDPVCIAISLGRRARMALFQTHGKTYTATGNSA